MSAIISRVSLPESEGSTVRRHRKCEMVPEEKNLRKHHLQKGRGIPPGALRMPRAGAREAELAAFHRGPSC